MDTKTDPDKPSVAPLVAVSITPANVVPSSAAVIAQAVASVAINAGQVVVSVPVVSPSSPPSVGLASASNAFNAIGIAINNAAAGQIVSYVIFDPALALGAGTCQCGDPIFLSPTAGGISITPADITPSMYLVILGQGVGGGKIRLDIMPPIGALYHST